MLEARGGTPWVWLLAGAAIVTFVFWALWSRQSAWVARIVWGLGLFRLPSLIGGAFFPVEGTRTPTDFSCRAGHHDRKSLAAGAGGLGSLTGSRPDC